MFEENELLMIWAGKENVVYVNVTWDVWLLIIWAEKGNVYVNFTWDVWRKWATHDMSRKRKCCLCKCYMRCLKKMSNL
jgi:hypothetical protein